MTKSFTSLLDELDILHEPREILGLVLMATTDAMARYGIRMSFGSFEELMAINAGNQDSWFPLHTAFRHDVGGADADNGIVIFGRDSAGKVVTAHAVRLFDWRGTDLKHEAESLRLFYADPTPARNAGEYCTIHADAAEQVTGRCAYIGGLWCHPHYRGRGRVRLITAVTRATALARWGFENLVGLMSSDNMAKDFHRRTGMINVLAPGGTLTNSPTHPGGDIHFAIAYLSAMQLVDELVKLLLDLRSEVDGVVEQRRA